VFFRVIYANTTTSAKVSVLVARVFFLNPESNTDTNDKFITVKFRGLAAMEKPDFIACPSWPPVTPLASLDNIHSVKTQSNIAANLNGNPKAGSQLTIKLPMWTCLPPFRERGAPRGSTMVLLGRVVVCSHRLSVQTTVVSRTVWPQFAMQVLTESCETPVWGRGGHRGLVMGILIPE